MFVKNVDSELKLYLLIAATWASLLWVDYFRKRERGRLEGKDTTALKRAHVLWPDLDRLSDSRCTV